MLGVCSQTSSEVFKLREQSKHLFLSPLLHLVPSNLSIFLQLFLQVLKETKPHEFPRPPSLSSPKDIIQPPPQQSPQMSSAPTQKFPLGILRVPKNCLQVSSERPAFSFLPKSPKFTSRAFPRCPIFSQIPSQMPPVSARSLYTQPLQPPHS